MTDTGIAKLENQREELSAASPSETRYTHFWEAEQKTIVVLGLALLPWVCVAMFTAGPLAAFDVIAYALLALLAGYVVVCAILPSGSRASVIVLAPATGVLTLSALTAFWLRLGLPLIGSSTVWFVLAALGVVCFWRDRGQLRTARIPYGISLVAISALICALYFIPGALNDAVQRPDGGFTWFSIDTQLYHSMVVSIRNSIPPPKMAGTSTAELRYHFGPYAVTAGIALLTRIAEGDALVRVTRGVEQWALIFSCFGLGTILSLKATGKAFGGLMSVVALFFYGSMLSMFSGIVSPHPVAPWPLLFESGGQFPSNGGPFSHLIFGISMLHGLEAITAVTALCLAQRAVEQPIPFWRILPAVTLPALVITVHSVAGLYCLGVVAILLFWGRLASARPWILMAVMFSFFLGAWRLMDYSHAPVGAGAGIQLSHLAINWWSFVVWFSIALGIRILSLGWVTRSRKDPMALLVLVSFIGLLMFSWAGALWIGLEHYGVYYLQAMLGVFAFSRLPQKFWQGETRQKWVAEVLSLEKTGLILFTVAGVFIGILGHLVHRAAGIPYFRGRLVVCVLLFAVLALISTLMKRSRMAPFISAVIMAALLVGFLGWIPPWFKYRTSGQSYNVTLTPGEVIGLRHLHDIGSRTERFATNKHLPTGGTGEGTADSYAYGALSGRPVLLEGSFDGAEENLPDFATLSHNNDLLFSTSNSAELRSVAQSYGVQWLVLRPGTDLDLPKPLPSWLVEQQDSGDLKIYRID